MLRTFYGVCANLLLPFLLLRLWWRGRAEPGYRADWRERLGFYRARPDDGSPLLWIHAVSLGETQAARPLVEGLLHAFPQTRILLTHLTATGRTAGHALCGERVTQAWLPWDTPAASRRFLENFRPVAGLLLETEIWPTLLATARSKRLPVFLVNARLSPKSAAGYQHLGGFAREAFASLAGVAAQSADDGARLLALGTPMPMVAGNLKFDLVVPPQTAARGRELRESWAARRRVWVAGSTREGEEALLLAALGRRNLSGDILTVIVPRHPQRFAAVAALLDNLGFAYQRRSANEALRPETRVLLGDSMGEMLVYYAAADFVFMGGSLLPFGCQNLIEACAVGRPVILGPSTYNFAQAAELALGVGAAAQVGNADELLQTVAAWADAPAMCERMGQAGLRFTEAHRGAAARVTSWLIPQLAPRLESYRFKPPRDSG